MSRATAPVLICDLEDGCDQWTADDYGMDVSAVNGVRVTSEHRSPGWLSTPSADYCPEHAALEAVGLTSKGN